MRDPGWESASLTQNLWVRGPGTHIHKPPEKLCTCDFKKTNKRCFQNTRSRLADHVGITAIIMMGTSVELSARHGLGNSARNKSFMSTATLQGRNYCDPHFTEQEGEECIENTGP